MIESVEQELLKLAESKYPGNEQQIADFMAGFEKEAREVDPMMKALWGLGASMAGAGVVAGVNSWMNKSNSGKLRIKFELALAQVMTNNRVVKGASPEKAKAYAETIFKFAPNVASDPNLLSSILANAILGEGIDQMTIKNLVDLEGRYSENTSFKPLPAFRT